MTQIFTKRRHGLTSASSIFLLLGVVAASLYGAGLMPEGGIGAFSYSIVAKGASVGSLALFALMNARRFEVLLLSFALAAGSAGDVFINGSEPDSLKLALYAFGLGHIFYSLIFIFNIASWGPPLGQRLKLLVFLWLFAGLGFYELWAELHAIDQIFLSYVSLVFLMANLAILSRYPVWIVGLGGFLFLTSDLLLGADQIIQISLPGDFKSGALVWPLYFTGQFLLALGIILNPRPSQRRRGYRFD